MASAPGTSRLLTPTLLTVGIINLSGCGGADPPGPLPADAISHRQYTTFQVRLDFEDGGSRRGVAEGTIKVPKDADGHVQFEGLWELDELAGAASVPSGLPPFGTGRLEGLRVDDLIYINLQPRNADFNVHLLVPSFDGVVIFGRWQLLTFSGVAEEGTVELKRAG
jgi:hypothetical protein